MPFQSALRTNCSAVERGSAFLLTKAAQIGRDAGEWSQAMLNERGITGLRVLQGFLSLTKKYSPDVLNRAAAYALRSESFRLRSLRGLCDRFDQIQEPEFLQQHSLIRPLSEYQCLIHLQQQGEKP